MPELSGGATQQVSKITGLLLTQHSFAEVLEQVVSVAQELIVPADGVGVTVVQDGEPATAARSDDHVSAIDSLQYELDEGPCLSAISERRQLAAADLAEDSRWPRFGKAAKQSGVYAVVAFPLLVGDDVLGALNVYSARSAFSDDHERVGSLFAEQAAVVVANARSFAAVIELNGQLRDALATREVIGQAKGLLMAREQCTADEAFDMLRRESQRTNRKLRDIAQQLVDAAGRL